MPFTIDGQWVPEQPMEKQPSGRPVKVRTERRGQAIVTVVLNLRLEQDALRELASFLKKRLGGGGTVKNGVIEVQGDKQKLVQQLLWERGMKPQ